MWGGLVFHILEGLTCLDEPLWGRQRQEGLPFLDALSPLFNHLPVPAMQH